MLEPKDVFIQRTEFKEDYAYISRTAYNIELDRYIKSNTNLFVSGQTGSGKTWLYEIYFSKKKIKYVRINLADSEMFDNSIYRMIEKAVTGKVEVIPKPEIIEKCFEMLYKEAKDFSYIVLDNLERVATNASVQNQIVSLIQCLEQEALNKYKVRFLLVGVPSSLKEFFHDIEYFQPIATRITEISKLNGFGAAELKNFLLDTLIGKLHFDLSNNQLEEIKEYALMLTDGIPLRVQQYLLMLADLIQKNFKEYDKQLLSKAAQQLLKAHYSETETLVEQYYTIATKRVVRGNQLLFILGKLGYDNIFTVDSLGKLFKKYFQKTTNGQDLRISRYLNPLISGNPPLIKKIDKTKFRLVDGNVKIWILSNLSFDIDTEIVSQNVQ